jgi:hypothetical protein
MRLWQLITQRSRVQIPPPPPSSPGTSPLTSSREWGASSVLAAELAASLPGEPMEAVSEPSRMSRATVAAACSSRGRRSPITGTHPVARRHMVVSAAAALTSSVRVRTGPPLCRPPFLQVTADREGRSRAFWCWLQVRRLCAEAGNRRLSVLLEASSSRRKIRIELVVAWPANENDGRCVPGGGQGGLAAWVVGGGGGAPVRRCACSMSWPSRSMACW